MNYACQAFTSPPQSPTTTLRNVKFVLDVFYNFSGEAGSCYDILQANPSTLSQTDVVWSYQACTGEKFPHFGLKKKKVNIVDKSLELMLTVGQVGEPNDFFWYAPWNLSAAVEVSAVSFFI